MVVREPDTLARSFDGEDLRSRVAVSDHRGDSGQAQVDMILLRFLHHVEYIVSSPHDAPMFSDALCRSSLKTVNYYFETLNSWFWNLDQSSPLLSTAIASLSYAWFLACAFKLDTLPSINIMYSWWYSDTNPIIPPC